ncbi:hypothetical protein KR222_010839, partial [Zaprionus bogoriensis]
AYGPIPDVTIKAISQSYLIYGFSIDISSQTWQLGICINCKAALYAKLMSGAGAGATPTHYLNSKLLCSNEELSLRRAHKSYSETFNLLIMDSAPAAITAPATGGVVNSASSLSIGSLSAHTPIDGRQLRLRQLQMHQQARVQAEINETNQAIERFTEQKFELLKSFREKSNQETAILTSLILQIPEAAAELLDSAMPIALEVTGGAINYAGAGAGARRRNTISSRRELGVPTTPTTPMVQPPSFLALTQQELPQQQQTPQLPGASILTTRKMSNFDTPPATPEATPMSVGNSPTFRQQQQQQQQAATAAGAAGSNSSPTAASAGADDADDCLFDLEDVDGPGQMQTLQNSRIYQQQQQQHYQRLLQQQQQHQQQQQLNLQQQQQQQQQQQDNMSDADEAEDALDLDTWLPVPVRARATPAENSFANFARSLPVEIANSPMVERANHNHVNNNNNSSVAPDDVLDNQVDIAASIKALAKSVHGEAVFGDLPRPRLRSQI